MAKKEVEQAEQAEQVEPASPDAAGCDTPNAMAGQMGQAGQLEQANPAEPLLPVEAHAQAAALKSWELAALRRAEGWPQGKSVTADTLQQALARLNGRRVGGR